MTPKQAIVKGIEYGEDALKEAEYQSSLLDGYDGKLRQAIARMTSIMEDIAAMRLALARAEGH